MNERPTPETDDAQWGTGKVTTDFARRLERERDEAREEWGKASMDAAQLLSEKTKVMAELDEAREDLKITQEAWVKAKAERVEAQRERDQARRELDIQLESIKFHMERVPVREHPLRANDAPLQDGGAEPRPLREGEPSDFCGAIRRMRDAERERDEARKLNAKLFAIAERVTDDLGWFYETHANGIRLELEKLKEAAK